MGWEDVVGVHMSWAWGFWRVDCTLLYAHEDANAATSKKKSLTNL